MDRHTTLGIAGAITLTLAAAATAIGVTLGIMSDSGATQGPGTFQRTAAVLSDVTVPTSPGTVTAYVDDNGQADASPPSSAADPSGAPVPATIDDHRGSAAVDHHDDQSSTDRQSSTDERSTDERSTDHQAGHDDDD